MTKKDVINSMVEKTSLTKKDAEKALNAFFETIEESMARGEEVSFTGFGKFEVRERAERTARNPRTGEEIKVPAKKVVVFKVGKTLQEKAE